MNLTNMLGRFDLIEASRPSIAYCKRHGIDFAATVPVCGGVFLSEIEPWGNRRFEPRPGGILAAWIDALDIDAETIIDVVAWPVDQPDQMMTLAGVAPALGMAGAVSPLTYALGEPLKVRRNGLSWLQRRCDGAVIVDSARGARWLLDLPTSKIAVATDAYARQLHRDRQALFAGQSFIVPRREGQPVRKAA